MTDKEKLALIDKILAETWEWCAVHEKPDGFFEGVLCAVSAVTMMEDA